MNDYAEYHDFRIGLNVDTELHEGKWVVVRHIPVSPDSYEPWGYPSLPHYDDRPTWEYTSPHNTIRVTNQTDVEEGEGCASKCHVTDEQVDWNIGASSLVNKELYLWQTHVDTSTNPQNEESAANAAVAIDSLDLPDSWKGF